MSKQHKKSAAKEANMPVSLAGAEEIEINESSVLQSLIETGVPCKYVKFVNPVALSEKHEPVYELKIDSGAQEKYRANALTFTKAGLIVNARGEVNLIPPGAIVNVRVL